MISGKRFARRDEELQTLLQGVGSVFRFGSQSGRLSDVFPILRRVFPRSTGATAFMDTIKNLQNFMKVRDVRAVTVVTLVIVVVIVIVVVVSAVVVVIVVVVVSAVVVVIVIVVVVSAVVVVIVIVVVVSAVVVVIVVVVVSTVVVVIAVVLVSAVVIVIAVVLVSAVVVVIDSTSGISSSVGGNRICDHSSACVVSSAVILNYEILILIRNRHKLRYTCMCVYGFITLNESLIRPIDK
jgi:hypothetical protein